MRKTKEKKEKYEILPPNAFTEIPVAKDETDSISQRKGSQYNLSKHVINDARRKELYTRAVKILVQGDIIKSDFKMFTGRQVRLIGLCCRIQDSMVLLKDEVADLIIKTKNGEIEPFISSGKGKPITSWDEAEKTLTILESYIGTDMYKDTRTDLGHTETTGGVREYEKILASFDLCEVGESDYKICGVLDIAKEGYGYLRTNNLVESEDDILVSVSQIRSNNLKQGDYVEAISCKKGTLINGYLKSVKTVNGIKPHELISRRDYSRYEAIYPNEKIDLKGDDATFKAINWLCPLGRGQRVIISSAQRVGKSTLLRQIASSINSNHKDIKTFLLLIDERPEEVSYIKQTTDTEVMATTFEQSYNEHVKATELLFDRCIRMAELGQDVVILLDSLTRLVKAYEDAILAKDNAGNVNAGNVNAEAILRAKRLLGRARKLKGAGSLTVITSCQVSNSSEGENMVYEELKSICNMEIHLDETLSKSQIYPAIDFTKSYTRADELLLSSTEQKTKKELKSIMINKSLTDCTLDLINKLEKKK